MEREVFIGHPSNRHASELAGRLHAKLQEKNISCFLDKLDIRTGTSWIKEILENVKKARTIVILFDKELSSWIQFEAACALFDEKLIPVSVNGAEVPPPYGRIQHEQINVKSGNDIDEAALDRLVTKVEAMLHGKPDDVTFTRFYRWTNRLFFSGLPILFTMFFAVAIIGVLPGTAYQHVHHLHVILGATIVGGQFFIVLGFARSVSSPSLNERKFGFETTERLFWIWAVFTALQPMLGLWLVLGPDAIFPVTGWVWLSLVLYVLSLLVTWIGYVVAKSAHHIDHEHGLPRKISGRNLLANLLFLLGFMLLVAVVNLMIKKPPFEADVAYKHQQFAVVAAKQLDFVVDIFEARSWRGSLGHLSIAHPVDGNHLEASGPSL